MAEWNYNKYSDLVKAYHELHRQECKVSIYRMPKSHEVCIQVEGYTLLFDELDTVDLNIPEDGALQWESLVFFLYTMIINKKPEDGIMLMLDQRSVTNG
jgi:hypothetical protein